MDNFYKDLQNEKCIVYSFGISDDYTFEKELGNLGCIVHAYDPTVELPSSLSERVSFKSIGLGHYTGHMNLTADVKKDRGSMPVTTLKDAIANNGDLGKEITYVKVDVEGSEIEAIPEWIQSGIINDVRQIGIELHTGKLFFDKVGQVNAAKSLLKSVSQLYDLGFRLISYDPNKCIGKEEDPRKQYYTFLDIVLFKPYTIQL